MVTVCASPAVHAVTALPTELRSVTVKPVAPASELWPGVLPQAV
jgi:hypothetical protein